MRTHSLSEPMGVATARIPFEAPRTFNAPLFHSLVAGLGDDRRWVILDLGSARPQTVSLLSRFRCRVDIADLGDSLEDLGDAEDSADLFAGLGCVRDAEPADIVFCWDFLNYLAPGQMTALMGRIAARCRPGAFVHALIAYSDRSMAQWPGQFAPIDEGQRLLNLSAGVAERIAPRYSPEDLKEWMPGFPVERARLLANGMQEYLFRLRRAGESPDAAHGA